jgi:EAL domain-containing protein (putative c-di-GMP-specific phosphodiesterase class I)/DNA-binding NarL/FixJ family response regulator
VHVPAPSPRTRVLIAEDDPGMRAALSALVASDPGLEVIAEVAGAEEAIVAACTQRPDVCVVDVTMPGGGGPRATREIRACSPRTRVVALSGREDRATVVAMLRAGASGYVVKGTAPDEVLDAIRRTAGGAATLSPAVTGGVVGELTDRLAASEREEDRRRDAAVRIRTTIDEGLLQMVFQPICDLATRVPVGYESLARFAVPPPRTPDVWFTEAAELGLALELELSAVRRALAALPALGPDRYLTLNVGPDTVVAPPFLAAVLGAAEGERLVVEVTEHAPIDDYDAVTAALDRLRAHGVRIAVDDAGAGFASLRHIVRLAPDVIKIDGTLTREVASDRTQRALTSALITFAREIGASIVAEGIETDGQIAALRELGVSYGQGFRLGRPDALPVPADERPRFTTGAPVRPRRAGAR